jgi:hypothetical protein
VRTYQRSGADHWTPEPSGVLLASMARAPAEQSARLQWGRANFLTDDHAPRAARAMPDRQARHEYEAKAFCPLWHLVCQYRPVETRQAFADMETDLRRLIREAAHHANASEQAWLSWPGAPNRKSLEKRRAADSANRIGAKASDELLDYTDLVTLYL